MAGEVEQPTEGQVEEEQHDEDDADFDAGFTGESTATQPTATPAAAPAPAAEPAPAPAPAEAPEFVQIKKSDWDTVSARAAKVEEIEATSKRTADQTFGKIGELTRRLNELQTTTPTGETVQISEEDFTEMKTEYPEMADVTIKGLNKVLGKLKGTGGMAPEAVDKIVGDRVATVTKEIRAEIIDSSLEAVMPGWKDEVKSDPFKTWIRSHPTWNSVMDDPVASARALADPSSALAQFVEANPADPVSLYLSPRVGDAAKMLRLFDKHRSAPPPAPAPAPTPAPPAISTRQRQIAAAVPPKGDGAHPPAPTGDDEFSQGFNYQKKGG